MMVYKGRGIEWFNSELPVMFDWMGRKKRVSGTATLALGNLPRPAFATMRPTDNRFYWLGVDKVQNGRLIENLPPGQQISPATIQGDIKGQLHHDSDPGSHPTLGLAHARPHRLDEAGARHHQRRARLAATSRRCSNPTWVYCSRITASAATAAT